MIWHSTIVLMRFPFSFFLMPVFLFAASQVIQFDTQDAIIAFFILHLIVYPSSNGYNSFMDRDESPIGGLKDPPTPSLQLYYLTIVLDIVAVLLGLMVSPFFAAGILLYILASKAYSWRRIRLKKYPFTGFFTVIIFQGALVYFLTRHAASLSKTVSVAIVPMLASALLVGSFYPLTQVYQHDADKKDNVRTISMVLGYKGTFVFSAICFMMANILLAYYFISNLELDRFLMIQTWFVPVLVYFLWWAYKVWKNRSNASFRNAMIMNILASICTNAAFIHLFITERI